MSFYNFIHNESRNTDDLYVEGEIVSNGSWFGSDTCTDARRFRQQLDRCGDVVVHINSPGGDVFAGAAIYSALRSHKGNVTVQIVGIAASAASVIAMAGDEVLISPVAYMMIHNPWTMAQGDAHEMEHQAEILREIGNGLVAAYAQKTGLETDEIQRLLDAETYMNAETAVELGFADGMLYETVADLNAPQNRCMMQGRRYGANAISALMRDYDRDPEGARALFATARAEVDLIPEDEPDDEPSTEPDNTEEPAEPDYSMLNAQRREQLEAIRLMLEKFREADEAKQRKEIAARAEIAYRAAILSTTFE